MSGVTIIWSMTAAVCLTLAVMHGLIGWRQPARRANRLFALTAVEAAAFAAFELGLMRSSSPAASAALIRWGHVPIWAFCLTTVLFVRVYLRGGRPWLAWAVVVVRTAALALDFGTGVNLNFRRITGLRHVRLLGEPVAVAVGPPNPWMLVGQVSLVLMVAFVADAAVTAWRRGDRRRAAVVGGSIAFFWAVGGLQAALVFWGVADAPLTFSLFYLGTVVAMGYDLTRDAAAAAGLAQELRASEHRLATVAEAANLGTWVRDLAGDQTWACDRWRALFDFAPAERVDLDGFLRRVHPDDRDAVIGTLAAAAGGGGYSAEYRTVRADGTTRWVACQGRFELDSHGRPVQMLGVALDITGRKRDELEARAHRENAAHLLRMATLGELASAVAHEVNQPLAAVRSNAEAAQRLLARGTTGELAEILTDIVADNRRAADVVRRVRGLVTQGVVHRQPVDVAGLVRDALRFTATDLAADDVAVATAVHPGLPPVRGDPVQLQQVLVNLLLNAAQAVAGSARKRVTVGADRSDDDGDGSVRLWVADTGPGIPAGCEEKVFAPYYTTKPAGMGLGLSLSRSIVIAHGGRLWADNPPGGGARITFTVPVPEPTGAVPWKTDPVPEPPLVCVVDDDPAVLRALGRLLRSADLAVATFASAADFLDRPDPQAAGCVLLDVELPAVDGPALQQMLARAGNPLPVVFLTGRGTVPVGVQAMRDGAVDFLTKPCDDADLLDAVGRGLTIDRERRRLSTERRTVDDLLATLTPRERQVMRGVVAGWPNKQIAADLGTAEKTVKTQRELMMRKLAVANVADLIRLVDRATPP